jgi:excisionase family DNA binding protein
MRGGSNVMVSPSQAAQQLGVSRDTIDRNWQRWGLRKHKLGEQPNSPVRFRQRDIDNYIQRTQT